MKQYRIKLAGLLILAGAFTISSFGQSPRYGRMDHRQGRNLNRQERPYYGQYRGMNRQDWQGGRADMYGYFWLDLSGEQQEQLDALRTEHVNKVQPLWNELAELRARQRTLLSEDPVDMDAVNQVIDAQSDLTNRISKLRVEHRVATRSILTEEQRQQLNQRRYFNRSGRYNGDGFPRSSRNGRFFLRNVG